MATANTWPRTLRAWPRTAVGLAMLLIAAGVLLREPIRGYARTAAAFGARTACSCRFIAGRSLGDCEKDFEPGMEAVFVSEDTDDRSVTARVPLIASDTARFLPGYGCVLDRWPG
ncbi:MAG: hypothetical protein ABIP41_05930 [Croceibacterium sp.]